MKPLMLSILIVLFSCSFLSAQVIRGKVVDKETGEPLPYVHIGVFNLNVGTISRDDGTFEFESSRIPHHDTVRFSRVGYKLFSIAVNEIGANPNIRMVPERYVLKEVTVVDKEDIQLVKLGLSEATKVTMGQSGLKDWGIGGEWGLKIETKGNAYLLQKIAFHTRFNTVDSVLFRINLYELNDAMPGPPIAQREIFVTSRAKDKWIVKDIQGLNVIRSEDFIVSIEIIRIWYSESGENQLFFTYGKNPANLPTYSRESSHSPWLINKIPPLAIYVLGRKLNL